MGTSHERRLLRAALSSLPSVAGRPSPLGSLALPAAAPAAVVVVLGSMLAAAVASASRRGSSAGLSCMAVTGSIGKAAGLKSWEARRAGAGTSMSMRCAAVWSIPPGCPAAAVGSVCWPAVGALKVHVPPIICLLPGPEPPLRGVVDGGRSLGPLAGREMLLPPLKAVPGGRDGPPELLDTAARPLGVTRNFMPAGTRCCAGDKQEKQQTGVQDMVVGPWQCKGQAAMQCCR